MNRLSFRQILIGEQMVGLWGLKELCIYPDRCDGCGDCLAFCAYGVYELDEASHQVIVVDPFNCLVGCDACARVCKRGAIRFPPREILARLNQ